jgi:hypothetical protein
VVSIGPWKARPKTEIGIVPTMMYQPMRASSEDRRLGSRRDRSHVIATRQRSWRKYTRTASIVPNCVTAVNAAPGSSQPMRAGTMRRCPDDEMGRNSVSPCTRPRTMAWKASMDGAGQ